MTRLHAFLEAINTASPGLIILFCAAGLLALLVAAGAALLAVRLFQSMSPTARADAAEIALVGGFILVVGGLIMQGLVDFARDEMRLTGVWPYLFFFALDGMAALFASISYRWAREGASPVFPRVMVMSIMTASAWFQWTQHAHLELAPRIAWSALPLISGVLWEMVLVQRRKAWKRMQPPSTEAIPRARWVMAPIQSLAMKRRMVLWGIPSYDEAVRLHVARVEAIRRLRRAFGPWWMWRVPADVAYQLRAGVRVMEAAERVSALLPDPPKAGPTRVPEPVELPENFPEDQPELEPWDDPEEGSDAAEFWSLVDRLHEGPEPTAVGVDRHEATNAELVEKAVVLLVEARGRGERMTARAAAEKAGKTAPNWRFVKRVNEAAAKAPVEGQATLL